MLIKKVNLQKMFVSEGAYIHVSQVPEIYLLLYVKLTFAL